MSDSLFSVADQVVLVSGASRGIGEAIARGFVERGSHVIISGREQATLDAAADGMNGPNEVVCLPCDVARSDQVSQLVASVIDRFGHIDTLINVAGVNRRKRATSVTHDDYDFIMDINLKGAFQLSQEVGRHMIDRSSGSKSISNRSTHTLR